MIGRLGARALRLANRLGPDKLFGIPGGAAVLGIGGIEGYNYYDKKRADTKAELFKKNPSPLSPTTSTNLDEAKAAYAQFEPRSVETFGAPQPETTVIRNWDKAIKDDLRNTKYGAHNFDPGKETALINAAKRAHKELKPGRSYLPTVNWDLRDDQIRHSSYSGITPSAEARGAAGTFLRAEPRKEKVKNSLVAPTMMTAPKPPEVEYYKRGDKRFPGIITHEQGHHLTPRVGWGDDWTTDKFRSAMINTGNDNSHLRLADERLVDFSWHKRKLAHGKDPDTWNRAAEAVKKSGPAALNKAYHNPKYEGWARTIDSHRDLEENLSNPKWQPSDNFNDRVFKSWFMDEKNNDANILRNVLHDTMVDEGMQLEQGDLSPENFKKHFPEAHERLINIIKVAQNDRPAGLFTGRRNA